MKKKLLIAMIAVLMLGLTACGEDKEKEDKKDKDEVVESVSDDKEKEEGTEDAEQVDGGSDDMVTKSGEYYIANTIEWGEEKDLTGLNLYCDKLTLPITVEQLNTYCAPFVYDDEYGYDTFYRENATSLDAIREEDYVFDSSTSLIQIGTQESWDEETNWTDYNEEYDCNITTIFLGDMTESGMTVSEALDGGYWYLEKYESIEDALCIGYEYSTEAEEVYSLIADKFGKPSYISVKSDWSEILTTNDNGSLIYTLVYERDDYTITISVWEMIDDGKLYSPQFSMLHYFSAPMWEDYKASDEMSDKVVIEIE